VAEHVVLIQDNAPFHTSAALRQFCADHSDRLTVYQLPPYSPDLSPIEGLWKKAKKDASHLRYFPEFANLVAKVEETLTPLAACPTRIYLSAYSAKQHGWQENDTHTSRTVIATAYDRIVPRTFGLQSSTTSPRRRAARRR
jgi:hypothetical protein